MDISDARYFEVFMREPNGENYTTHVWAYSEFGVRECMAAQEPEDTMVAWRIVPCACDGESRCTFHASANVKTILLKSERDLTEVLLEIARPVDPSELEGAAGDSLPEICPVCHVRAGDVCQCSRLTKHAQGQGMH